MSTPEHNSSLQKDVAVNSDPALTVANEHHHTHTHHSSAALAGRQDDVVEYNSGLADQSSTILNQAEKTNNLHRRGNAESSSDDIEKQGAYNVHNSEKGERSSSEEEKDRRDHKFSGFYQKYRIFFHGFFLALMTAWWIVGLVLHRDRGWLKPFLLWLAITLRIITLWVPITPLVKLMRWTWNNTGVRIANLIPEKLRVPAGALLVIAVIIVGSFASAESADNTRANRAVSLFGIVVCLAALWATSRNRKRIPWHTVIVGMLMQFIVALFVLRTKAGFDIFAFISELARDLLGFANQGSEFLLGEDIVAENKVFFLTVIPAIIFFVALVQLLYYLGTIQWFIGKFAKFFFWAMRVSGAEAVVASASPFIGQGESAMLIKPFVAHLTMAELHQVMTSGFATIAGSVLVAYIGMGINPQALISSCVMSIPASLAMSKLRYPEEEETLTSGRVVIPDDDEHRATNALHAFANGAWLGLKIAGMIVSTLLCIIAFIALIDGILTWWGHFFGLEGRYDLTLELVLGYICYPIAFLLGVSRQNDDLLRVGELIGIKVIANEFVAYNSLQTEPAYQQLSSRSRLIATYALCGFGNIGSLGTQIGVLSQIAPGRAGDVSKLAVSSLITGILSTLSSAAIAGMLVTNQAAFVSSTPS